MTDISPISPNQRTPIIDILRGWALFSVVIMNYLTIFEGNNRLLTSNINHLSSVIENILEIILGSKGWSLLSILFGYGFSVLLKKISERGLPVYTFFIKRMLWLFVLAFINTLFFGGDFLNDYAFMGLILLFFYNFSPKSLFICGVTILLLTPLLQSYLGKLHLLFAPKDRDTYNRLYASAHILDHIKANLFMRYKWMLRLSYLIILHLIQLSCFLIGVALQRKNFFVQINRNNAQKLKWTFWISLVFSIASFFLQFLIEKNQWPFNDYYNLFYPQILCIMVTTTTGIMWLYVSGGAKIPFSALQTIGKMTLSNYMIQNIIAFILFTCLKINGALYWYLLTGFGIYIVQIFFSKWWLSKYNYGPFEWLWRCLSYSQLLPLKKQKSGQTTVPAF